MCMHIFVCVYEWLIKLLKLNTRKLKLWHFSANLKVVIVNTAKILLLKSFSHVPKICCTLRLEICFSSSEHWGCDTFTPMHIKIKNK